MDAVQHGTVDRGPKLCPEEAGAHLAVRTIAVDAGLKSGAE